MQQKRRLLILFFIFCSRVLIAQETAEENLTAGRKLKAEGKCTEALPFFLKAIKLKNEFGEAYYEAGWCYNELSQFDMAVENLSKAEGILKNNPSVIYEKGYALYKTDSTDKAFDCYKRVLELDSAFHLARIGIGDIYRDVRKNPAEALKWYLKVVEAEPGNSKANYWAGWCYNDLKQFDKAIGFLQKVTGADTHNYVAYAELGFSYYSLGNYEAALSALEKTEPANPKIATAVYYLGLCHVKKGNKPDAIKKYNELELMGSELAPALLNEIKSMQ